jgi:hypothetical protein
MATRTSLYSFQNNIIEIAISIDAIGELHSAITPLTKEERSKFGLLDGDNPWRHLGVPDFVLEKPIPENDMYDSGAQKCSSQSSTSNTDTEDARKRSLSNVSITSEDIQKEMEEFSSTWADNEENEVVFHPEVSVLLQLKNILLRNLYILFNDV